MRSGGKVTLSEIARQAGTSPMAVSVVLNGARSNTRVSDATRERIVAIAAALNYTPNALAQGLRRQRTETLGVLFTWAGSRTIHNLYAMTVLDGIVEGAAAFGFHVLIYNRRWESATESSSAFSDQRVDGMIVVAPPEASDVVPTLHRLGVALALVSSRTPLAGIPFVDIDNPHGIGLALSHLYELGHRRIAYLGQRPDRHSMRARRDAFCAWMHERALPTPERFVLANLNTAHDIRPALRALLTDPEPPTGVVAANDDLAVEVIATAQSLGLSVPTDLSVVGFDDIPAASLVTPKLTTVRQPLYDMGQEAVRLLIRRLSPPDDNETLALTHIITPELMIRDSTAAPNAARTPSLHER